jgi:hypothetical protein
MDKKFFSTMPKAILNKWLRALRSGEYEQGQYKLYTTENLDGVEDDIPRFCCLGVLQHCLTGGVEFYANDAEAEALPTEQWLKDWNIKFVDESDFGALDTQPTFKFKNGEYYSASELNDGSCKTFKQIALIIENHVVGV